jgi:hypothetical protein
MGGFYLIKARENFSELHEQELTRQGKREECFMLRKQYV